MTESRVRAMLELAERCKKATGADRILDVHIAATVFPKRFGDARSAEIYRTHRSGYNCADREYLADVAPHVTASIDAALTLVPKGAHGQVQFGNRPGAWVGHEGTDAPDFNVARTPALALCAAALRARAADTPKVTPNDR